MPRRLRVADEHSQQRSTSCGSSSQPASISGNHRHRKPGFGVISSTRCHPDGDSALHVIAAAGDGDRYLESAKVVYGKSRHLLTARNKRKSTPLHCAARAGNVDMLSLLIRLARDEGGDDKVASILKLQNEIEETALHEAIRADNMLAVDKLMRSSPCLARVPGNGTSPLFLAISLRRYAIARAMYARDNQLSNSGPRGQNVLHAAVLQSQEMTELLLQWNRQLTKQQDDNGNTPLDFAVSVECRTNGMLPQYAVSVEEGKGIATLLNITDPPLEVTKQLLEADPYSAYQPNRKGSFPIHIAASAGRLSAVKLLVTSCASLRDSHGRTFLHVAVKSKRYDIVTFACQTRELSSILNKQDNDGIYHLAVEVGDWWIFSRLFVNKQVNLDLSNNRQHTPRDLSIISIPTGLYCLLNSRILIQETLTSVNATHGIYRLDDVEHEYNHHSEAEIEKKGSEIVSNSTVS